ncbi:hypothetical protein KSS87_013108, partial [Heliosperma pusillum]
ELPGSPKRDFNDNLADELMRVLEALEMPLRNNIVVLQHIVRFVIIHTIAEYKIIPFAQPTFLSMDEFERENSLHANMSHNQTEQYTAGTKFVWNDNLTRKIRDKLKNSDWTVALLHGFFKHVFVVPDQIVVGIFLMSSYR